MVRAIIGSLALLGAVSLAHAAGPDEDSIYGTPAEARWAPFHANDANVPACNDLRVLSEVTGGFAGTENEYWGGVHAIEGYEHIREVGFRSNSIDTIPRRYCIARALVVDSRVPPPQRPKAHTIIYQVNATNGPLGMMWGVEWCVAGFDREHAYDTHFMAGPTYDPACAVLRPIVERRIGVLKQVDWFAEYGLKARY